MYLLILKKKIKYNNKNINYYHSYGEYLTSNKNKILFLYVFLGLCIYFNNLLHVWQIQKQNKAQTDCSSEKKGKKNLLYT